LVFGFIIHTFHINWGKNVGAEEPVEEILTKQRNKKNSESTSLKKEPLSDAKQCEIGRDSWSQFFQYF
jgi:hypothetical protein